MEPILVSVEEAATSLSVDQDTLWRQIRAGRVKTVRIGRRVLVPMGELQRIGMEGSGANRKIQKKATVLA
jgi:excisionase family DNA binding protein